MLRVIAVLLLCVTVLYGCESMPFELKSKSEPPPVELLDETEGTTAPPVQEPGLALSPEQRFADIPLPMGAREDIDRTYVYESPSLQIGRMVYTVKASVSDLAQFYIKQAPAAGWKQGPVLQAEGAQLTFYKPDKRLDVRIEPQGIGRSALLVLNLTPESETDAK